MPQAGTPAQEHKMEHKEMAVKNLKKQHVLHGGLTVWNIHNVQDHTILVGITKVVQCCSIPQTISYL